MTTNLLFLLAAAAIFGLAFIVVAVKYDTLRSQAIELVTMATGGRVKNPLEALERIISVHAGFISDQRSFGMDAERSRRNRCPSASLSMRERWVICAMGELNGEIVPSLAAIGDKLGLKVELVSLIARTLAATGYAKLVALAGDQGAAAGRGYVLTVDGRKAKAAILGHRDAKLERSRNHTVSGQAANQRAGVDLSNKPIGGAALV